MKFRPSQVVDVAMSFTLGQETQAELARRYKKSESAVYSVLVGLTHRGIRRPIVVPIYEADRSRGRRDQAVR